MAMTARLAMDAHFRGHDGALLLAEYSFAEITQNQGFSGFCPVPRLLGAIEPKILKTCEIFSIRLRRSHHLRPAQRPSCKRHHRWRETKQLAQFQWVVPVSPSECWRVS